MWYAVSRLFESCHPDHPSEPSIWEESIVLVDAESYDEARQEAERRGKSDEHEYISATGEPVQWRFRAIERVFAIDESALESGTEVFSRFLRAGEAASLLANSLADGTDNR